MDPWFHQKLQVSDCYFLSIIGIILAANSIKSHHLQFTNLRLLWISGPTQQITAKLDNLWSFSDSYDELSRS